MIKQIRHLKGSTQKEIYLNLCSRRQYSRIENNKSLPSIFLLYSFALRLGVPMESLVDLNKNEERLVNNLGEL